MSEAITGGCQCGAVRYRVSGRFADPSICHCRMCQKASGNYFMPLANVRKSEFEVTRGEISYFHSSEPVRRGFCRECGTPLIYEVVATDHTSVTLGSLDDPAAVRPLAQDGMEGRMPWFAELDALPGTVTEDADDVDDDLIAGIRATNHQHPDHDTDRWPPEGTKP